MTKFTLTEEGRLYLKRGFPEVSLAKLLTQPLSIKHAQKKIRNFKIAVQWAKKRGWIKIEEGVLVRTGGPTKIPEEDALARLAAGKPADPEMIDLLLKRNLIKKEQITIQKARRFVGKEIGNLTPELIKTGLWRKVKLRPYNVSATGPKHWPGKAQPYVQFLQKVRHRLIQLGFKEMGGPIIETEFWNFDALYQPQNHPARDWASTYSLKHPKKGDLPKPLVEKVKATHENGWKTGSTGWGGTWSLEKAARLTPRAHGTACSARRLAAGIEIPGKYFALVRCFRPDVIDATHGVEFNQCEGIVIDPSLNFRHLLGTLKMFAEEIAGAEQVRFCPDYYPFTEPSVQLSAKHPKMGWIEFAGAGIFRPELTLPLGVKEPVLAWGLGIDRLAMFRLNIKDIRQLFSQNLDWLRKKEVLI